MPDDERLLQEARIEWIRRILGSEPWVIAYSYEYSETTHGWLSSFLVDPAATTSKLSAATFDVPDIVPGFVRYHDHGEERTEYLPTGDDKPGREAIVVHRSFSGLRQSFDEIVQEFRLMFNLWPGASSPSLSVILDNGVEEEVVRFSVEPPKVQIRLSYLRRYMAAKQLALVLCVDYRETSAGALQELGLAEGETTITDENLIAQRFVRNGQAGLGRGSFSRLLSKKVIPPPPREECGIWPYEEPNGVFEEFIIGFDTAGRELYYSCDPSCLSNANFDQAPNTPDYLTPVHFRREVLQRYVSQPEYFSVEDGLLRCQTAWTLQIDTDHPKHVVVYLGDLGRDLPEIERPHWKLHNVAPDGPAESQTSFRRNRLAQFTEPNNVVYRFQQRFKRFSDRWEDAYGWPLFKPLRGRDAALPQQLRLPLNETRGEFETAIRVLSKNDDRVGQPASSRVGASGC